MEMPIFSTRCGGFLGNEEALEAVINIPFLTLMLKEVIP